MAIEIPTVITLELLCDALSINLSDFFAREDEEIPFEIRQLIRATKNLTPSQISILNDFLTSLEKSENNEVQS